VKKKVADILRQKNSFLVVSHKNPDGDAIGSSLALYNVLKELGKEVYVEVETRSSLTMGMTVVDYWGARRKEPNCLWVSEVNDEGFFQLMYERLATL
jgi:inosine-uridine nucleoside N-ribohydrolase